MNWCRPTGICRRLFRGGRTGTTGRVARANRQNSTFSAIAHRRISAACREAEATHLAVVAGPSPKEGTYGSAVGRVEGTNEETQLATLVATHVNTLLKACRAQARPSMLRRRVAECRERGGGKEIAKRRRLRRKRKQRRRPKRSRTHSRWKYCKVGTNYSCRTSPSAGIR